MNECIFQPIRLTAFLLITLSITFVCGCGKTTTVSGKVVYKGRPVTHGSVVFLSVENKKAWSGVIIKDGSYVVEGVAPGAVKIAVISRNPSKGRTVLREEKPAQQGKKGTATQDSVNKQWFPLPQKFENPESSGIECILDPGLVNYDIDLK